MFRSLVSMFLTLALLTLANATAAQAIEMEFGPEGQEAGLPVKVVASEVLFDQNTGNAVFAGKVVVTHGTLTLKCDNAEVVANPATAVGVDRIILTGGVHLDTGEGTANSQLGEYNVTGGLVTMTGDVSIQFKTATMRGESLVYDVATGRSRLSSDASIAVGSGS